MPKIKKPYHSSANDASFTARQLLRQNKEIKMDVMEAWLRENYMDPANCCPYDDGDYVYIWGGPYDASEALSEEFDDEKYESLIEEVRERLSSECVFWSPQPSPVDEMSDIYYEQFEIDCFYEEFKRAIYGIEELLNVVVAKANKQLFYRLVYSGVISAIEAYLGGVFIKLVTESGRFRSVYIAKRRKRKKGKLKWSAVHSKHENYNDRKHFSSGVNWHNLEKAEVLYRETLGVSFFDYVETFKEHVNRRHDIVHRNGKNIDGGDIFLKKDDIKSLLRLAKKFVSSVSREVDLRLSDPDAGSVCLDEIIDNDAPF